MLVNRTPKLRLMITVLGNRFSAMLQKPLSDRRLGSATDAIPLPEPKPRTVCVLLIMPLIRSREVTCAHRSCVRHCEDVLQPLDFRDGVLSVHVLLNI
jgi:hypothetical protein